MLYQLLFPLHTEISVLNVVQYITFRTAAASLTAFVVSLVFGPVVIKWLRALQIKQVVRKDGPVTHSGWPCFQPLVLARSDLLTTI